MSTTSINLDKNLIEYMLKYGTSENSFQINLRNETSLHKYSMMQISPEQGQFMGLLAKIMGARNYLEIGTFTGYSAMCMAFAMGKNSKVMALDSSKEFTSIAQRHWVEANIHKQIELKIGLALDTLDLMQKNEEYLNSFDIIFIDADKINYKKYFEYSLKLIKKGGVILIDNVFWNGNVVNENMNDDDTLAIRSLNEFLKDDERVSISMLPIGDGLTLVYVGKID